MVERVGGEKVAVSGLPALNVTGKLERSREELSLKLASMKASHMGHFLITVPLRDNSVNVTNLSVSCCPILDAWKQHH
jgi:hypothetical protein